VVIPVKFAIGYCPGNRKDAQCQHEHEQTM